MAYQKAEITVTKQRFLMNRLLKQQLDIMINAALNDFDSLMIVDGQIEGSGKSVLAQQMGFYLANTVGSKFSVKNIVFTPKEFKAAVLNADKYTVIIWDEAYKGANKFRIMSSINQSIMSLLQQIRQRNLFIILVLPYFFDLTSYVAIPRSWFLIHVYLKTQIDIYDQEAQIDFNKSVFERGHFRFYSRKAKKTLYFRGKKEYNYNAGRGDFIGNFPNHYTVDEAAYKEKKANIDMDESEIDETVLAKELLRRGMEVREVSRWVNRSKVSLYSYKNQLIS